MCRQPPLHCLPQRGANSLLYLLWCPQHRSPPGAVGGCPAQGLLGHTRALDCQKWDCHCWGPWLSPPTAKWASKDASKCTVTKNGLLTRANLKRKWDSVFLVTKSKFQMKSWKQKKTFAMRCVWRISAFTIHYFTARNLSCPGNKSMCLKGMSFKSTGKLCTFQVTSLEALEHEN